MSWMTSLDGGSLMSITMRCFIFTSWCFMTMKWAIKWKWRREGNERYNHTQAWSVTWRGRRGRGALAVDVGSYSGKEWGSRLRRGASSCGGRWLGRRIDHGDSAGNLTESTAAHLAAMAVLRWRPWSCFSVKKRTPRAWIQKKSCSHDRGCRCSARWCGGFFRDNAEVLVSLAVEVEVEVVVITTGEVGKNHILHFCFESIKRKLNYLCLIWENILHVFDLRVNLTCVRSEK
jgi:hypothetical protein